MSDLDERIRSSFSRLAGPDEAPRASVWESVVARRRRRQRRAAVLAVPVVAALGLVVAVVDVPGGDGDRTEVATGSEDEQESVGTAADRRGEPVVSVEGRDLGPLQVTSSRLHPAEGEGWLVHTITLTNTGGAAVHLNDFRAGAFLGDREVLVATEGCGYGASELEPVGPACQLSYRPVTIAPGDQHRFTVTLWRSLTGMNPVTAERYQWQLELQLGDAPFDRPDQVGDEGHLLFEYELPVTEPTGADVPTYDLPLPEAELVREEQLTARSTDVAVWGDGRGRYLTLTVRFGPAEAFAAPSGVGPMIKDETWPDDAGEVWLSEPGEPGHARMWWVRPSGDLWLLDGYWYGEEQSTDPEGTLRDWARTIEAPDTAGAPYVIEPGFTALGSDAAGDVRSRARVWDYDGREVTLLVVDQTVGSGLSNLLAKGAPTVADHPRFGQLWSVRQTVGWPVAGADGPWATLQAPSLTPEELEAVLDALTLHW